MSQWLKVHIDFPEHWNLLPGPTVPLYIKVFRAVLLYRCLQLPLTFQNIHLASVPNVSMNGFVCAFACV